MFGNSAKRLINYWHTEWLGEKDANGDLVGSIPTRSSSSAGIAMWKGSTVTAEEPV